MNFTSVRGHIMNYKFGKEEESWKMETIKDLYSTEANKYIMDDCKSIEKNLKDYGK